MIVKEDNFLLTNEESFKSNKTPTKMFFHKDILENERDLKILEALLHNFWKVIFLVLQAAPLIFLKFKLISSKFLFALSSQFYSS